MHLLIPNSIHSLQFNQTSHQTLHLKNIHFPSQHFSYPMPIFSTMPLVQLLIHVDINRTNYTKKLHAILKLHRKQRSFTITIRTTCSFASTLKTTCSLTITQKTACIRTFNGCSHGAHDLHVPSCYCLASQLSCRYCSPAR